MFNMETVDYTADEFERIVAGAEDSINAHPESDSIADTCTVEAPQQKLIKKDELVKLAADVELFCEPDGNGEKAYATVPVNGHFGTLNYVTGRKAQAGNLGQEHGALISSIGEQTVCQTTTSSTGRNWPQTSPLRTLLNLFLCPSPPEGECQWEVSAQTHLHRLVRTSKSHR